MTGPATTPSHAANASLRGVWFLIAGIAIFSFQDVAIKWLSGGYTVHEIMLVRSVVALPAIVVIAWFSEGLRALIPKRPWVHLVRACATFFAYTLYYLGLADLPLADAATLYYSAPLFITLLAIPFLSEHVGWRRGLAIVVGFAGVLVILRPGVDIVNLAALLVIASSLSYAISAIITRRVGATETGVAMAMSACLFNLVASGAVGLLLGHGTWDEGSHASLSFLLRAWSMPDWGDFGLMALCGIIFGGGYYCLTEAYRVGRASSIAPFEYTALPWSVLWGWVAWQQLPDWTTLAGLVLIVGSGLYVLRREKAVGQKIVAGKAIRPRL
jgi:drug/metabolite transporter (DMT)-like permease